MSIVFKIKNINYVLIILILLAYQNCGRPLSLNTEIDTFSSESSQLKTIKAKILYAKSISDLTNINNASNLIDEDMNTRWSSEGKSKYFDIYLAQPIEIRNILIAFYNSEERRNYFDIYGSYNNTEFFEIKKELSSSLTTNGNFQNFNFDSFLVDHLRIIGRGNSSSNWNSFNEIEVFGIPAAGKSIWALNPSWEGHPLPGPAPMDPPAPVDPLPPTPMDPPASVDPPPPAPMDPPAPVDPPSLVPTPTNSIVSKLFGSNGEKWDRSSSKAKLYDFSFAGYRMGNEIPETSNRPRVSIASFGAVKNDGLDDSAAIIKAIKSVAGTNKVVFVPNGTYELDKPISIKKLGKWVLRGESRDGVIFKIDQALCIVENTCSIKRKYSFGRGFIEVWGASYTSDQNLLASVTKEALRNNYEIYVSSASKMRKGQLITLTQKDPADKSLQKHLHGDLYNANIGELVGRNLITFTSKIESISGNKITLQRALPSDIKLKWTPKLYNFKPIVEEVGLENFTIKMKLTKYKGHFQEDGYNGIDFRSVENSWVSNVQILNADFGINLKRSQFVTLKNMFIGNTSTSRLSSGLAGHHAIQLGFGGDNLIDAFEIGKNIGAKYQHGLTMEWAARGNVFMNGGGYNLSIDHHGAAPYQNLFTNIKAGLGSRLYFSGGASNRMPRSAAHNVYWNIQNGVQSMPCDYVGGNLVFVGVPGYMNCQYQRYNEKIPASKLFPQNLFEAQRMLRP